MVEMVMCGLRNEWPPNPHAHMLLRFYGAALILWEWGSKMARRARGVMDRRNRNQSMNGSRLLAEAVLPLRP
jgi:hypothetical protein